MTPERQSTVTVLHNRVPNRIRVSVPVIKYKQTYAELLKQNLLQLPEAKGIYHAEPNVVSGTMLLKYHPAFHTEADVLRLVRATVNKLGAGGLEISSKHKNPRVGKMPPAAFFTRELLVSVAGNVLAGLLLAVMINR